MNCIASAAIADAIWGLFNKLSPEDRDALVSQLLKAARPLIPASRAGDVLATIARFLPKQRDWTAKQIRQEVSAAGITASSREVFNAIGYLIRKGHVVRKGGGCYEVQSYARGVALNETYRITDGRTAAPRRRGCPGSAGDPRKTAVSWLSW